MAGSARMEALGWLTDCLRISAAKRPTEDAEGAGALEAPLSVRGSVSISYGTDKVDVPARGNTAAEELAAVASMLGLFGWVAIGPWLTFVSLYFAVCGYRIALLFFTAVVGAALLPAQGEWPAFRNWQLFDTWRRYHRMHLVVPPLPYVQDGRAYLFAHFPHATFPMGAWLSMSLCGAPETGLPARTKGAVASIIFRLPVMSQFFTWMGNLPADRGSMLAVLARGESVGVVPEGIAGIFTCTRQRERIYARHKGYARLAIQAGVDVVPVYHLGQAQVLSFAPVSPTLSRKIKTACGLFYGRYGLPLPNPAQIVSVVGTPIPVVQRDEPTQAEVDALHARVLAELTLLFEQRKHLVPALAHKMLETLL